MTTNDNLHVMTGRQRALAIAAAIAILAILGWRYHSELSALWHSARHYRVWLLAMRSLGPIDMLLFVVLLVIVANIPGAPISVLAFFAGVCFGHWPAFLINAVGMSCGNMVQTYIFRRVKRRRQSEPSSKVYQLLLKAKRPEFGLAIGYAVPMIPTLLVNVAANNVSISRRRYITACVAGSSTVAFIYAFSGDLVTSGNLPAIIAIVVIAVVALGIAYVVQRLKK